MVKVSQDLNVTKHKNIGENRMDLLLEQMAAESEDAEFVEVKEVKDA
jgi:DNA-binding sugar fermentation-stimulating protein